ncbi:Fic/DOC family N-terminal domain-containing protein [Cellulomonas fimi]|uniref:Fic family protein n=1 Tax=Cellulomonas fimi TaxID=1708 RepID=A0A7Y0QI04_CELFI|nr:Fic/DOC family N-terminal domain-containing protein [Cellulomonas fimi]NMR19727.1 Fic family protein [Cellulomonas fimi]
MDKTAFESSPVGSLVAIRGYDQLLKRLYSHHAFVPASLPREVPLSQATYKAVTEAALAVGRLDAAAQQLPNPRLLVRPVLYREAVSTSALEGTYAPLREVLEADAIEPSRGSSEVRAVLNYVRAAELGIQLVREKPLCVSLLSQLQKVLVSGTRGDGFDAGDLRSGQVYIGERHKGIEASRYVPPPEGQALIDGMSDWEKWLHQEDDIPLLVRVALAHYQFESLHPYSDGNGRLGRLVIVLQLVTAGALSYPILNLSPWLEPRKDTYKDRLLETSQTGDFNPWVTFFCDAVTAQAADTIARINRLVEIRAFMLDRLRKVKARGVVLDIVEDLIGYPIITPSQAASLHNVTYPPANNAIQRLEALGLIREITGGSYARVYACPAVMDAVETPDVASLSGAPLT